MFTLPLSQKSADLGAPDEKPRVTAFMKEYDIALTDHLLLGLATMIGGATDHNRPLLISKDARERRQYGMGIIVPVSHVEPLKPLLRRPPQAMVISDIYRALQIQSDHVENEIILIRSNKVKFRALPDPGIAGYFMTWKTMEDTLPEEARRAIFSPAAPR